jgi:large subunit ribosomal protein L11
MAQVISVLVNGGEATAGAALGGALGPLGIPVGKVIGKINEATKEYKGLQVPVKVIVNPATKEFELEVGMPPTSALVKKELGLAKGTGDGSVVGDISWDKVVQIAKARQKGCLGADLKKVAKEVIGTCQSMGVTIEGKPAKEFYKEIETRKVE